MKKSDLKVNRKLSCKTITVYCVRVRFACSVNSVDIVSYFDKVEASSYCEVLLSRNPDIESAFVAEREVILSF